MLKMIYRGAHDLGPSHLNDLFNIYVPNRALRSENKNLLLPSKTKTKFVENDITVRGSNYGNILDDSIKLQITLDKFEHALKPYGSIKSNSVNIVELCHESVKC